MESCVEMPVVLGICIGSFASPIDLDFTGAALGSTLLAMDGLLGTFDAPFCPVFVGVSFLADILAGGLDFDGVLILLKKPLKRPLRLFSSPLEVVGFCSGCEGWRKPKYLPGVVGGFDESRLRAGVDVARFGCEVAEGLGGVETGPGCLGG